MACLSKIQSAVTYDCDGGNVGFLSAMLINKEDIASITFDPTNPALVTSIVRKEGASVYKIDTVKRTLVITESLKVNEGAPNAYKHTAVVTVTGSLGEALFRDLVGPAANGSFVILAEIKNPPGSSSESTYARPFGLYYGLSATAVDRSSHENGGWYTITMETPERVIGEDALAYVAERYKTLYNTAIG